MESKGELKGIDTKNRTCYYFNDIIKFEDFYFCNILCNEKPYGSILIYDISRKTLGIKHYALGSIKKVDLLKFMMELDI